MPKTRYRAKTEGLLLEPRTCPVCSVVYDALAWPGGIARKRFCSTDCGEAADWYIPRPPVVKRVPRKIGAKRAPVRTGPERYQRRAVAAQLLGGACEVCGYKRCLSALHFHHAYGPKSFGLGAHELERNIHTWEEILEEIAKCQLLCSTHHSEAHAPPDMFDWDDEEALDTDSQ